MILPNEWMKLLRIILVFRSVNFATSRIESVRHNHDKANCMSELVSYKLLSDDQFSASSFLENKTMFGPKEARLVNIHSQSSFGDGNAWCPNFPASRNPRDWIEVNFKRMVILKVLYAMGTGDGNFQQFSPEVIIKYRRSNFGEWITYHDKNNVSIIPLNTDARTKIRLNLKTTIAKKIRIYPLDTASGPKGVCLRFAFLGCYFDDDVTSYSVAQGDTSMISNDFLDLRDFTYDGKKLKTSLSRGIGVLMDNIAWRGDFDLQNVIRSEETSYFTGWFCQNVKRRHISIRFNFDEDRTFHYLKLFSVRDRKNNIDIHGPVDVFVKGSNHVYSLEPTASWNAGSFNSSVHELIIEIRLNNCQGSDLIVNISCDHLQWILLSEIFIFSTKSASINQPTVSPKLSPEVHYVNISERRVTSLLPEMELSHSMWRQKDITLLIAVIVAIFCLLILLTCLGFVIYKKSKESKCNKKLEIIAKRKSNTMSGPSTATIFTIPSKNHMASIPTQRMHFSDTKTSISGAYSGSQSDGVYASWPNTDEEVDTNVADKEEEKRLITENKSSNKEYVSYQPICGIATTNEYYSQDVMPLKIMAVGPRLSGTNSTIHNSFTLSDKSASTVPIHSISSYEVSSKSTPSVAFKTAKRNHPSSTDALTLNHLLNYRGVCGDVDFRYSTSPNPIKLDSNIKVLPITSFQHVHKFLMGCSGFVDVVKMTCNTQDRSDVCFIMKSLMLDSSKINKSNFIVELKILASLNCNNLVQISALATDNDKSSTDPGSMIKSANFRILIDHPTGWNLKEFLNHVDLCSISSESKLPSSALPDQMSLNNQLLIISQIANGMRYLEELSITHRDLGCRNCTIDPRMVVTIYPGGLITNSHDDYCSIEVRKVMVSFPLRWMAPESLSMGLYSLKSDVWSFAVTIWEVFTCCSILPYCSLTNEALLDLILCRDNFPRLSCPQNCPKFVYEIMLRCWNWDATMRPSFEYILKVLQIKMVNSSSQHQIILPAPPPLTSDFDT